jgi:hypothetical protein
MFSRRHFVILGLHGGGNLLTLISACLRLCALFSFFSSQSDRGSQTGA